MSNTAKPVLYWFRQDLRLSDLPGLYQAFLTEQPIIPCFILDDETAEEWAVGGASRWWLQHSLEALNQSLEGKLIVRRGRTCETLLQLQEESGATGIFCSALQEPWHISQEQQLKTACEKRQVYLHTAMGNLLFPAGSIRNKTDKPYQVFTAFWRACQRDFEPRNCLPEVPSSAFSSAQLSSLSPAQYQLIDAHATWHQHWHTMWTPGQSGAQQRLSEFLSTQLGDYERGRDFPHQQQSSRLSAHLHWGEISPLQVWQQTISLTPDDDNRQRFLAEIGWREFNHQLLYSRPELPRQPVKSAWQHFPWQPDKAVFKRWCEGKTGYPIVDAGMRELWHTGNMHNRVRMICASFLCKHLLQPWQWGQAWFWDTLLDADLANNSCNWQWVAGCGADAAPYFRIFNPTTQGEKFDKQGRYVRRWVPELNDIPTKYLHRPWDAAADLLSTSADYPAPIVEHKMARERALQAYRDFSEASVTSASY